MWPQRTGAQGQQIMQPMDVVHAVGDGRYEVPIRHPPCDPMLLVKQCPCELPAPNRKHALSWEGAHSHHQASICVLQHSCQTDEETPNPQRNAVQLRYSRQSLTLLWAWSLARKTSSALKTKCQA
jgi:hypothetical protein